MPSAIANEHKELFKKSNKTWSEHAFDANTMKQSKKQAF